VWVKSISVKKSDVPNNPNIIGDFSIGHFKPVPSNRYLNNCFEFIFHFTKKGDTQLEKLAIGVPYQDKSNIKRWMFTNNIDNRDVVMFGLYHMKQFRINLKLALSMSDDYMIV
jgi:site-specific DNA-methyltransferase (adenine-specific)